MELYTRAYSHDEKPIAALAEKHLQSVGTKYQVAMTTRSYVSRRYVKVCPAIPLVFNKYIMSNQSKQRICIKFCAKLGKASTQTVEMLTIVFGDDDLKKKHKFLSGTNDLVF